MNRSRIEQEAERLGIEFTAEQPDVLLVRRIQGASGQPMCCGTDEREGCRKRDCRWRTTCYGLVAFWLR